MIRSKEYEGEVAVITGAARGIGRSIARRLAEEGARVFIADINAAGGRSTVEDFERNGLRAEFIQVDLSARGGPAAMIDAVVAKAGAVHVLVNNARAGQRRSLLEETEENWDLSMNVGSRAAFFASQAAIRQMASKGGCRIVNIASVAAILATNEAASYHAAKAALLQLTRYLAVSAGPVGTRVNAVLPGFIVQEEHRGRFDAPDNAGYRRLASAYQPLGEVGSENDVAEAVLYLCSSSARYVSGACLTLDGGACGQEPFGLLNRLGEGKRSS